MQTLHLLLGWKGIIQEVQVDFMKMNSKKSSRERTSFFARRRTGLIGLPEAERSFLATQLEI